MGQYLTLSRAARLVGVSRGILQKRIHEGELPSQDGMISTADLLRIYPDFDLAESGDFERILRIKEEAFGRRVQERMLPSTEVLAQRLFAQGQELADLRRHLKRYHDLVVGLQDHLRELSASDQGHAPLLKQLDHFVEDGLADVLGSSDTHDNLAILDDVLKIMSAHVIVRPSGHEFFVAGHDSLLKAGVRAGLMLNYGCGNGNCGLCKARVVSGEVRQLQHCDYVLSDAEKQQGYTLLCSHTAVSDVVLETLEASGPADIPEQRIVAKVKSLAPVSAQAGDTLLLHLQTPRSNRLRFLAGQSLTLGLAGAQGDFSATYPVASCPCDDRNLLFHIHRDAQDDFALRLFAGAVASGDDISLWGPWGDFVLRQSGGPNVCRPLLFLACDGGFAPVKSLIEHATAIEATDSIALYWTATRPDGHYLANQCRAWAEALDEFRYVPLLAEEAAGAGQNLVRAVRADYSAAGDANGLAAQDVYLAGPAAFVAAAQAELAAAGTPPLHLYVAVV